MTAKQPRDRRKCFLVWKDRFNTTPRIGDQAARFSNMADALEVAARTGRLVTECVPLGDPRLLLIEEIAREGIRGLLPEDQPLSPLETLALSKINAAVQQAAMAAVKEAESFEFQRGYCDSPEHTDAPDEA